MIKRTLFSLISCISLLIGAGCIGQQSTSLEDTMWTLDSYRNASGVMTDVVPGSEITARFSENEVEGNGGCNHYFGEYDLHENTIAVNTLAMTEMYCMTPGIMEQESVYFSLLQSVAYYEIEGTTLTLKNAEGEAVLVFTEIS